MSKIVIGEADGKNISFDLDVLLRSRLLIQANSGKGKSWLLRRLAEQMSGKVQVIIIDPEGEFATLREKYDYALIGKGGDGAAHPKIAALTAQRLLEVRASAVCDLYEMKPSERHAYVKVFLDALIDAPKTLWHPLVVILDEAHVYCPEKGAGESEASEAVISLATRGRKRGYCLIPATQRLGKFRKDAAAEMLNVAIGGTFIDIDRKRAADALGVYGAQQHEFFDEIRLLPRGEFYMLGPAVSDERILVKVGAVETTHPEAGSAKHSAGPPPPTEKIKALLPKLVDLPQEAEQKAKTEAELRTEIRSLKAKLSQQPKAVASPPDSRVIERAVRDATAPLRKQWERIQPAIKEVSTYLARANAKLGEIATFELPKIETSSAMPSQRVPMVPMASKVQRVPISTNLPTSGDSDLTGPERKILRVLGELLSIGKEQPPKNMVAAWSGYSPLGGAFGNPIGALRSKGLIDYPQPGLVTFTEAGRGCIGPCEPPDQEEIWRRIENTCTGPEQKILKALLENAGSEQIAKELLAEKAGYSPIGGAFGNPIGALRTKGLLDYPRQGVVQAADWLFL